MSKAIMRVEGVDGQLELLPDRVVIRRDGLWNAVRFGFNAAREIPLGAISEITFRGAGFQFGKIEFVRSGRSTDEKMSSKHSAVRFAKKQNAEFEAFKEKVFQLINQNSSKVH